MEAVSRSRSFTAIEVRSLFFGECALPLVRCDGTDDIGFGASGEDSICFLQVWIAKI